MADPGGVNIPVSIDPSGAEAGAREVESLLDSIRESARLAREAVEHAGGAGTGGSQEAAVLMQLAMEGELVERARVESLKHLEKGVSGAGDAYSRLGVIHEAIISTSERIKDLLDRGEKGLGREEELQKKGEEIYEQRNVLLLAQTLELNRAVGLGKSPAGPRRPASELPGTRELSRGELPEHRRRKAGELPGPRRPPDAAALEIESGWKRLKEATLGDIGKSLGGAVEGLAGRLGGGLSSLLGRARVGASSLAERALGPHADRVKAVTQAVGAGAGMLSKGAQAAAEPAGAVASVIGKVIDAVAGKGGQDRRAGPARMLASAAVSTVGAASPGQLDLFNQALEDISGVLGQTLLPLMEPITLAVRTFGDVLATILPNFSESDEAMAGLKAAFQSVRESVMQVAEALAPFVKGAITAAFKVLGFILQGVAWVVDKLATVLKFLWNVIANIIRAATFGFVDMRMKGDERRTSVGAAQREAQFGSFEAYGQRLQKEAFRVPGQRSPNENLQRIADASERTESHTRKTAGNTEKDDPHGTRYATSGGDFGP